MWKAIVAGTAALAIAGSTLVYAQHRSGPEGMRWQAPNMEDMRAFGEARLAGLRAGLMLTPEQEKNWPAFEQAARDFGKLRIDRMAAMRNAPRTEDPAVRMNRRASAMMESGIALKKLAEATEPLYKSLDDSQKRRFAMLSRLGGPRMDGDGPRFRGWHHRDGGDGPRHYGPRRTDGGADGFDPPGAQRL
jgi:zinc resistance-associated protein